MGQVRVLWCLGLSTGSEILCCATRVERVSILRGLLVGNVRAWKYNRTGSSLRYPRLAVNRDPGVAI